MRFRIGTLAAVICLFALGLGAPTLASVQVPLHWDQSGLHVQNSPNGGVVVSMQDGLPLSAPGQPDLPWVLVEVPLPDPGTSVQHWNWEPTGWQTIATGATPVPAWSDRPQAAGGPVRPAPDPAVYEGAGSWPVEAVRYQGIQISSGRAVAHFLVCPFRWSPLSRELEWAQAGVLTAEFGVGETVDAQVRLRAVPGGADFSLPLARATGSAKLRPSLDTPPVEFLVITTEALAPSFEPLVEWKNRQGVPAAVRTTEWIYANYTHGVDQPERIRLFLRDAWSLWGTETVLLGGDPTILPIRYAQSYWWQGALGGIRICSDYYYACLDGNWNADGDLAWGEGVGPYNLVPDRADLTPELKVGRVSAVTPAQIETWIGKYMKYAKDPETSSGYLDSVLLLGEVLFPADYTSQTPDSTVDVDGATDCLAMMDTLEASSFGSFFNHTLFLERWQFWNNQRPGLGAELLNRANAIGGINAGHNLLFHTGHGDRDRLAVGSGRLLNSDLMGATNGPEWVGLAFTVNCNSAAVDADCVAEAFQNSPDGGGVNYFGSTNLDFPATSRTFQNRFFHDLMADPFTTPGEAAARADSLFAASIGNAEGPQRFLLYSLMMLGDPDLNIWRTNPGTLQVTAPTSFALGSDPMQVTVRAGGFPIANARVCLYKADDAMAVGFTNASGIASVPFDPTTTGSYRLTVVHPLARPYEAGGTVTAATAAYVTLRDYTITDDGTQGSRGNGNGRIEAGETVAFNLLYANRGAATATGVQAALRLSETAPGLDVQMIDSTEVIGDVAPGTNGEVPAAFLVAVANAALIPAGTPTRGILHLDLDWTAGAQTQTQRISPEANRADLELIHTRLLELDLNGSAPDSLPTVPGEVIGITAQFYNQGAGTWSNLRTRLVSSNPGTVDMIDSVSTIPELPPGGAAVADTFKFELNNPTALQMNLIVEDTTGVTPRILWSRLLKLRVRAFRPVQLKADSEPGAIVLSWDPPPNSTYVWGYRVYRSTTEEGGYQRAGTGYIEGARVFRDEALPDTARYWYNVAAVDSSGIEGARSLSVFAVPSPKQLAGWPRDIPDTRDACPLVDELNDRGDREVLVVSDVLHVFSSDGGDYIDGDDNPATIGRFTPDLPSAQNILGKAASADLDLDGTVEVVIAATNGYNGSWNPAAAVNVFDAQGNLKWQKPLLGRPVTSAPALGNIDGDPELEIVFISGKYVWAFNHDGTSVNPNFPDGKLLAIPGHDVPDPLGGFYVDWLLSSVALADLAPDLTDTREEIVFTVRSRDAQFDKLYIINGVESVDGQADTYGTNVGLFPFTYSSSVQSTEISNSSPAIGNFTSKENSHPDSSGNPDIAILTANRLWAFDPWANTSQISGKLVWSRQIRTIWSGGENPLTPSPALGDIDGDDELDIAVGAGSGSIHVFDGAGIPLPGFTESGSVNYLQVGALSTRMGSPILADLDGEVDPTAGRKLPEVIIGDYDGYVHAFNKTGNELPGFPYHIPGAKIGIGLCAWDIDRDDHQNLVIQTDKVQAIQVLDFPACEVDRISDPEGFSLANPWPEFRHDHRNTGNVGTPDFIVPVITLNLEGTAASLDVSLRWHADVAVSTFTADRSEGVMGEWESVGLWNAAELSQGDGNFLLLDQVPAKGEWSYRIEGLDAHGEVILSGNVTVNVGGLAPYRLHPAQPNPFNPRTVIKLDLPGTTECDLRVVDVAGRTVRRLLTGKQTAGAHEVVWDGRNERGLEVGSGIYFVRATAVGQPDQMEKVVLLK